MTMADEAVTLVAVLPALPLASLIELLIIAAGAGATAVMVAVAGATRRAAAVRLADFRRRSRPESSLSCRIGRAVAAARAQGVELRDVRGGRRGPHGCQGVPCPCCTCQRRRCSIFRS
jgi:hypothetical protein